MTPEKLPGSQPSGITLPMFIGAAVIVIAAAMAAVWFAFPAPDTLVHIQSPSSTRTMELGELCENSCTRVAILDVVQPDGTHIRTGCPIDYPDTEPLFVDLDTMWLPDEAGVEFAYTKANGERGRMTIATADCTLTE